ncbi:MAG TPA: glycosyltransferase family 4 protein [Oscillatoriales cyanobacterium M59_W2019_021]|nr:glycosyltransferase family 4 protein [Oscillatoriales cyanobacterium M4454_W2019_049]HIK52800.1 glycosyltransferase family 4 protein [Oscillatoriales cyanobacterium M59_W2019_021]
MSYLTDPRVLIVAEHASLKYGGEAALPLHYFRVLRRRGIDVRLIVHERTKLELQSLFSNDLDRIYFVEGKPWKRFLVKLQQKLPHRLACFSFGTMLRLSNQLEQRRIARQIMQKHRIDIIHQPMPVSPKEPSLMFDLGVPVAIGPMNGGIDYPPAFRHRESRWVSLSLQIGRLFANGVNRLIPGKRHAQILLVANQRTKAALPKGISGKTIELVENGVDFSTWQSTFKKDFADSKAIPHRNATSQNPIRFVYVGRLVDWKGVDLLLPAFKQVAKQLPATLEIIGDGVHKAALEAQARSLGLMEDREGNSTAEEGNLRGSVRFSGWQSPTNCAQRLHESDALVLPSLMECGGAVVLEAMAMGLPVIATNWGGPADYLDESCGILVDPTSPEEFVGGLAAAMTKLALSPELRQAMGRAARQRVRQHFDWEVKADKILQIYQMAIDDPSQCSVEQAVTLQQQPSFST